MTETRNNLLHDIEEDSHDHMYVQTFVLPDLTKFPADYRAFLEKDLIETSTLVSLEQAGGCLIIYLPLYGYIYIHVNFSMLLAWMLTKLPRVSDQSVILQEMFCFLW